MAYNKKVAVHNRKYLMDIVSAGHYDEANKIFRFSGLDRNGNPTGFDYYVKTDLGLVARVDKASGERIIKGNPMDSQDRRGYMTIEMVTPYDTDVFANASDENLYRNMDGDIVGVQYTAYVHNIMEVLRWHLFKEPLKEVGNHMNGCKLDNRIDNIESVSQSQNALHGAALFSIFKHSHKLEDDKNLSIVEFRRNRKYSFPALIQGIRCAWVEQYASHNHGFAEQLYKCIKSLRGKHNISPIDYRTTCGFIDFLFSNEYWSLPMAEMRVTRIG